MIDRKVHSGFVRPPAEPNADDIKASVNEFLETNPVTPGASAEEAAQIKLNAENIEKLQTLSEGLDTVVISDSAPNTDNKCLWIQSGQYESFDLPQINDETVSEEDTWSSKKISDELNAQVSQLSEEIANLQSGGNDAGTGMTTEVKTLMLSLFKAAVYNNPEMQVTVDALEQKWTSSGSSDGEETVYYIITNNLTNVSNSNSAGAVAENTSYSATLTADSGYDLESVTVAMGGTDITSTAYTDGVIHISAVTGNVVIAATASATIEARTVYFASDDSIVKNAGNMNKAGEIKATTNVRCKVAELPYIEGMLIHTYCNPAGVSSDYPPFIFFDGINYTVPEFTTPTDYNHEIILSGQTGIEKVYVNMYGTVQGEFADDRFYYVTQ